MLSRLRTRCAVALVALAGMTNAVGPLAAQGPTRASTGTRSPTLVADCDYQYSGCGGDPTYEGGEYNDGSTQTTSTGGCGTGSAVECRKDTYWKCLKWTIQTVGANVGATPGTGITGGGTTTMVCEESVTTVLTLYWPKS